MTDNINAEPGYGDEPPFACSSIAVLDGEAFACGGTPGHAGKHRYLIKWDSQGTIAAQDARPAPGFAAWLADQGEVVHLSPRDATYVTPCCGQAPFDLRRTDRMTNDPSLVTCGGPEPKAAPGFAAWLADQGDALGDGTYTAADMAAAYGMGQAEPLTVKPADDVKAAPELAAAMRETRLMRERLDAIRELCKNRIRVAGADGKGIARKVIAIIDKPEGK